MRASRVNPTCVDRSSLWRSGLSGAPLHFVTRCTASGTHDTDRSIRHSCLTTSNNTHSLVAARFCVNALSPQHALAGPIPVFSCFSADSDLPSWVLRSLTTRTPSFPRRVSAPGVLHRCFTHPESRGGRSAEKRSGAALNTRGTRHLASKTRVNALMTRDARLSALHRGGFGLPGPRFRLLRRPPSYNGGQLPCGSVQRAPRTQVVVPGGRGPCLPRRTVTSRRRRTPRLAPHSGSSLEHALNERGWASSSIGTIRSQ